MTSSNPSGYLTLYRVPSRHHNAAIPTGIGDEIQVIACFLLIDNGLHRGFSNADRQDRNIVDVASDVFENPDNPKYPPDSNGFSASPVLPVSPPPSGASGSMPAGSRPRNCRKVVSPILRGHPSWDSKAFYHIPCDCPIKPACLRQIDFLRTFRPAAFYET